MNKTSFALQAYKATLKKDLEWKQKTENKPFTQQQGKSGGIGYSKITKQRNRFG